MSGYTFISQLVSECWQAGCLRCPAGGGTPSAKFPALAETCSYGTDQDRCGSLVRKRRSVALRTLHRYNPRWHRVSMNTGARTEQPLHW